MIDKVLNDSIEENKYYIQAHALQLTDQRTKIIKEDSVFGVFNVFGDIHPNAIGAQGIFDNSTRMLSLLEIKINNEYPLLLSSNVKEDNSVLTVDLSNPDIMLDGKHLIHKGILHLHRTKFIWNKKCFESIVITNFSREQIDFSLQIKFDADFADIFEIRGMKREKRGIDLSPIINRDDQIQLRYQGLDGIDRSTYICFYPSPHQFEKSNVKYQISIGEKESQVIYLTVGCNTPLAMTMTKTKTKMKTKEKEKEKEKNHGTQFNHSLRELHKQACERAIYNCFIETSNEDFNEWLIRSSADMQMLLSETEKGLYPFAGIPWYSNVFGRDGIITAIGALWVNPQIARGVLDYLASYQATIEDPYHDAEPGKILHEKREGEMAETGEVPFKLYYGSVDSTPLFIVLAGLYYQATNDLNFVKQIWPNIQLALQWINQYGDQDGDGFVEYYRKRDDGLINQGWKDSYDSIFHDDGQLVEGPVALCEVQGYVYEAKVQASLIAERLGDLELAASLKEEAMILKQNFEDKFWCPEINSYALALDGNKNQCKVLSSNAGQCLFTGIANEDRAHRVAQGLFKKNMFSGWGIRTISTNSSLYNPMSYHNGSIWPHDNGLIAMGLSRYHYRGMVLKILKGLFYSTKYIDLRRLPELFCGFTQRPHEGPTLYPVACIPQAWATVTVYFLLQACLGLKLCAPDKKIYFHSPQLPYFIDTLKITNLKLGDASIDVLVNRHPFDVGIITSNKIGDVNVIIVK